MLNYVKSCLLGAALLFLFTAVAPWKEGEKDTIVIGTGGGISGQTTMYTIDYQGNVYKESGTKKETSQLGKISKKDLHSIKKEIENSGFYEKNLRDPGNIYYYIETVIRGKNHKVTWGNQQTDDSKKMQSLYNLILEKINKSKS